MAAMPSVGRIKQLSVLGGVAAALLAVGASSASAAPNEVWLWACHGPNGEALSTPYESTQNYGGTVTANGGGCTANGGSLTLSVPSDGTNVKGFSQALAQFPSIPGNTAITTGTLSQSFANFGQAGAADAFAYNAGYTLTDMLQTVRVSQAAPATADQSVTAARNVSNGSQLRLNLLCDSGSANTPCAAAQSPSITFSKAGLQVVEALDNAATDDAASAPKLAVGGKSNPAAGDIKLDVQATDSGVGLDFAEAYLAIADNTAVVSPRVVKRFADSNATCGGLQGPHPGHADRRRPAAGRRLPDRRQRGSHDPDHRTPSRSAIYPNGDYTLIVRVVDLSGRETIFRDGSALPAMQLLNNVDLGSPTPDAEHRHERPSDHAGREQQRRQQQWRRRRELDAVQLAAPVGRPGPEAGPRLQGRAGPALQQALPLHGSPDLRDQRQAPVGAQARPDRPAEHGRQEDRRTSRARRSPPRAPSRSSCPTRARGP